MRFLTHRFLILGLTSMAFATGFHLIGSTWTLKSSSPTATTFTAYRYDNSGNRIRETVFSPDSNGSVNGETFYEYDLHGRLARSIVLTGNDTSSIALFARDTGGRILATTVTGARGTLKYVDSNSYQDSFLKRTWRTNAFGSILSEHHYDSLAGVSKSDTLFAPDAGSQLAPVQAIVATLDNSGRVASEADWQCIASLWYQTGTKRMEFASGLLSAVTSFEGDGNSRILVDSVHYGYDQADNRIEEDRFDSDRQPTQSWSFVWEANPVAWTVTRTDKSTTPKLIGRELSLPTDVEGVKLYDLGGRLRWERLAPGEPRLALPASLPAGTYLAALQRKSGIASHRILIGN